MNKLLKVMSYLCAVLLGAAVTLAIVLVGVKRDYSKLAELEQLIADTFVGDYDKTQIEDAAADAMIQALGDRWSYYISAEEYDSFMNNKNNEYVGIGITVEAYGDGKGLRIVEVTSGGPSEEAGLLAGDIIVEADGVSLLNTTANEAGNVIRGEENTQVSLKILRNASEMTVSVTRKKIQVPVATGELLDHGIGLVTIQNFNTNCFAESKQAVEQLLEAGAEKLIFDVRNNGGGYANEMVKLLDYLLPEGQLFKMVDYDGKETVDMSDAACIDVPMAVLVNGGSYSAAECFAAALREYGVAVVVGEKTSGKGYYQIVYRLQDGSAVGLSVGKYYTPQNNNLEGVGLEPDHEVAVDEETAAAISAGTLQPEADPQIQKAVSELRKN